MCGVATVLLLPGTGHDPELASSLGAEDTTVVRIQPVEGPEASLAARVCAAIAVVAPEPPLVIVASGADALLLPAVALAQRSAHRRVTHYVLVEPELPVVNDSWPDAPVTVVSDEDGWVGAQARLRGWRLIGSSQLATWRAEDV